MKKKMLVITIISLLLLTGIAAVGFVYRDSAIRYFFPSPQSTNTTTPPLDEKAQLLHLLGDSVDKRDYAQFSLLIKQVYDKHWISDKDFSTIESKAYMNATNELFEKGKLDESLKVSTQVYNQTPTGWRFRYLRIRTFEKMGRQALEKNDLDRAEKDAQEILTMMFRTEGTDLLADVYIARINDALKAHDFAKAQSLYTAIKQYEVSAPEQKKLDEMAKKLHN